MNVMEMFGNVLSSSVFVAIAVGIMYVATRVRSLAFGFASSETDQQIEEESNLAAGLSRGGFFVGIGIALIGAIVGPASSLGHDSLLMLKEGALAVVLLLIAAVIADTVILPGIKNREEIGKNNVAVGLVELGVFVSTGLIAFGSVAGEGGGLFSVLAFFVLGQVALVITVRLYEFITPFDIIAEIKQGNASAGLMLSGILISIGVILNASLSGEFVGWFSGVVSFLLYGASGLALLGGLYWVIDVLFLPNTNLKDEIVRDKNVSAVTLTVCVLVATSFLIAHAVI